MMYIIIILLLLFIPIEGNSSDSSSWIVLRHVHLSTDNQYHQIHCPDQFNHLTFRLLNYSNEVCFNLYSPSNICRTDSLPCRFQAKPIQLSCFNHSYSKFVDISYQCSSEHHFSPIMMSSSSSPSTSINHDETLSLFLIGFGMIITIWMFFCCIWFICCHDDGEDDDDIDDPTEKNSQFLRSRSSWKDERMKCSLTINPLESKSISSYEV